MPATKRGVYHNLRESKYAVSNTEIAFFFSSEFVMTKYLTGYQDNREKYKKRMGSLLKDSPYNLDLVADICFYQEVEKRGFYSKFKNVILKKDDLYKYALRKMSDENTLEWVIIKNGKNKNKQER
jgi:hypothetical protein